jgi:hypothetical protein
VSPILGLLVGTVLAACLAPGVAWAQESFPNATSSPAVNAVEVRIGAVLASNSGKEFDQRLTALHRQFDTLFPYSSYRLVKEERLQVPWGGKVGFDIPGGRYVLVIPKEFKNDRILMKVMLIDGPRPIVDTALSLRNHATFLVGGPRQPDGVLILSIGAGTLTPSPVP